MLRSVSAAAMLLLTGCTIVRIESQDHVSVRAYPGVLRIAVDARSRDVVAYSVRGLGLVPTRNGVTLGWAAEDAVLMSDLSKCRILLFKLPGEAKAEAEWRRLIAGGDVCLAGEKSHEASGN